MIVAPLMTAIMAAALAIVTGDMRRVGRSLAIVATGAATSVGLALLIAWLAPGVLDLDANGQVTARVTPRVVDLLVALASGAAGAIDRRVSQEPASTSRSFAAKPTGSPV
jgi:uncharacterized membrane protein